LISILAARFVAASRPISGGASYLHCNKFLTALNRDTERFLAYIRIYLKKDRHIWSLYLQKKLREGKRVINDDDIRNELAGLKDEIAEISRKSPEEIAQIIRT
jgi:hypothetical protein